MTQKLRVKKLQNSPYVISPEQVVGKGSFSTILRAYNMQDPKQELVSKIISIKDSETSVTIKTELQILKKLPHHPNLVNCMKFQISSENNFYLIMEYCNGGNLDKYMYNKKNIIPQEKIWFFLKQFCEGYKVLYNNGIVHRDIKPENILIHNGDFKIADFGLSKNVDDMEVISNMSSKGTPLYMAPELHGQKQGSSKVDIFSLGVVLYRLAFGGQYPFFDQGRKYRSINEYFKELLIRKLVFPEHHGRSGDLVELIEKMLVKDKEKRISWKEVFEHERIKMAIRYERKKELAPIEELQRSLTIVNKSQTEVKIFEAVGKSEADSSEGGQSTNIILEETFNKRNKNHFEKRLFQSKLLYTLIEYTNKKMQSCIAKLLVPEQAKKRYVKAYSHIQRNMQKIIEQGILFSLFVISGLEVISGDWTSLNSGEIMNFEDIFENDKLIFLDQYHAFRADSANGASQIEGAESEAYIIGSYQDTLYNILSEYFEYPTEIRTELRPIFGLLLDIYDLAVKSDVKEVSESEKSKIQRVEDQTTKQFYDYLLSVETIKENELKEEMKKKGLIFV